MTNDPPFGPIPPAPPPPPKPSTFKLLSMWLAGVLQARSNRRRAQRPPPGYPQNGYPQNGYPQTPRQEPGSPGQYVANPQPQGQPHQQRGAYEPGHHQPGHEQAGKKQKGNAGDGCDLACDACDGCDLPCFDVMFVLVPLLRLASPGPARPRRATTGPARAGLAAIRLYQRRISRHLPTRCRYTPSCSAYGAQAVGRYGLVAGSRLTAERIARCTSSVAHGTPDPLR